MWTFTTSCRHTMRPGGWQLSRFWGVVLVGRGGVFMLTSMNLLRFVLMPTASHLVLLLSQFRVGQISVSASSSVRPVLKTLRAVQAP